MSSRRVMCNLTMRDIPTEPPARNRAISPPVAAQSHRTELEIDGMSCSNCVRHVTEALQTVSGVKAAQVDLATRQATVRWNLDHQADVPALIQAVKDAGYAAQEKKASEPGTDDAHCGCHAGHDQGEGKLAGWQLNLWMGVLGTLPLMIGEWVLSLGSVPWFRWFSFAVAAVVQVFGGAPFYRGALNQLKSGSSNMDTLVALGSTTAFGYSVWALLSGAGGHLYFMEAAAIITLISVGHWVESRVSVRASSALRKLLNLAPSLARRRNTDGSESEVSVSQLSPGDIVSLRPGDAIPTDGEVIEGTSTVDESMLTGESVPADKSGGTLVYGGTVNLDGRFLMRVTATG